MKNFWVLLLVSFFGLFFFTTPLGPIVFLGIGIFAIRAAFKEIQASGNSSTDTSYQSASYVPSTTNAPIQAPIKTMSQNIPTNLKCPSCGASIKASDKKCGYCGSSLTPALVLPEAFKLGNIEVGQNIRLKHPAEGEQAVQVIGRILYSELTQTVTRPDVPWTPTGSYYAGFVLDNQSHLLNWQSRFFLFGKSQPLTDQEINRDFLPYARQFGASNQTARVTFSYASGTWKIDDIGKFQVEYAEGEGIHLAQGASGRFIHASNNNQILVVEDFQGGGGGQDKLWMGYLIQEQDIQF